MSEAILPLAVTSTGTAWLTKPTEPELPRMLI